MNIKTKVGAWFKLQAVNVSTGAIRELTDWFPNLVLDSGLERMGVGGWITGCSIGTGNSLPVESQVQLDAFLARTTNAIATSSGIVATPVWYQYVNRTWRFTPPTATGNLSELGLGWGDNLLWNRALIRDSSGNPTTITVLPDEFLDVISQIRVYPNTQDATNTINIRNGVGEIVSTHTATIRPANIGTFSLANTTQFMTEAIGFVPPANPPYAIRVETRNGSIGGVTGQPSGSQIGTASFTSNFNEQCANLAYIPDSHSKRLVARFRNLAAGNGSISAARVETSLGQWQVGYSPAIIKTSNDIIDLNFQISWGRYTP